jgi:predicted nucleotidyltransferase
MRGFTERPESTGVVMDVDLKLYKGLKYLSGRRRNMETNIKNMANDIIEKYNPIRLILFGSHARGDESPDSDVDFLVVIDCPHDKKREMEVAIRRDLRKYKVPKDIVIANPEDISHYHDAWWTVYEAAIKEGKVLYEQRQKGRSSEMVGKS